MCAPKKGMNFFMNIKNLVRFILIILIICNCIVIFNFSSEKSGKSDETSGRVVNAIVEINPRTRKMSVTEKQKEKEKITKPIRKTAHFTVYTSLGVWLSLLWSTFNIKSTNKILISLLCAFIYACSDEIHQLFVPGRSGQFTDVLIDSSGALFGILIVIGISVLIKKYKLKKLNKV